MSSDGEREHSDLPYSENSDGAICHDTAAAAAISPVPKTRNRMIRFEGRCPYCFGDFTYTYSLKVLPASSSRPAGQGSGAIDVTLTCQCPHRHKDAPAGQIGCGRSWVVEITSDG